MTKRKTRLTVVVAIAEWSDLVLTSSRSDYRSASDLAASDRALVSASGTRRGCRDAGAAEARVALSLVHVHVRSHTRVDCHAVLDHSRDRCAIPADFHPCLFYRHWLC